jgi:hypothetical protein
LNLVFNSQLLGVGAAPLYKHAQHNGEQYTGYHPDNCDGVHCDSPFLQCLSLQSTGLKVPVVRLVIPNQRGLLDRFAPALNQNCQHSNKKNAAYDANDQNAVHFGPLSCEDPLLFLYQLS